MGSSMDLVGREIDRWIYEYTDGFSLGLWVDGWINEWLDEQILVGGRNGGYTDNCEWVRWTDEWVCQMNHWH